MPRQSRIDAPGALHHVMIRGIDRTVIFRNDEDRESFLDRLGGILMRSTTPCYAWSLLSASIRKYGYVFSGPKPVVAPSALSPEAINSSPNPCIAARGDQRRMARMSINQGCPLWHKDEFAVLYPYLQADNELLQARALEAIAALQAKKLK
jgi:hypothetical protein